MFFGYTLRSFQKAQDPPSNIIPKYDKWKFLTFIKEDPPPPDPPFYLSRPPMSYRKKNWGLPIFSSTPPSNLNSEWSLINYCCLKHVSSYVVKEILHRPSSHVIKVWNIGWWTGWKRLVVSTSPNTKWAK